MAVACDLPASLRITQPVSSWKKLFAAKHAKDAKASNEGGLRSRQPFLGIISAFNLGLGMEAGSSTPEQLGTMTREGLAKMAKLIKGLGIKAE